MKESKLCVKIGDFGLACLDRLDTDEKEADVSSETPPLTPSKNGKFVAYLSCLLSSSWSLVRIERSCFSFFILDLNRTKGVGTLVYASPEQTNGLAYDNKVSLNALPQLVLLQPSEFQFKFQLWFWLWFWFWLWLWLQSDMYSLGIILFELFHPFRTNMEKVVEIDNLKRGILPDDLKKWKSQVFFKLFFFLDSTDHSSFCLFLMLI